MPRPGCLHDRGQQRHHFLGDAPGADRDAHGRGRHTPGPFGIVQEVHERISQRPRHPRPWRRRRPDQDRPRRRRHWRHPVPEEWRSPAAQVQVGCDPLVVSASHRPGRSPLDGRRARSPRACRRCKHLRLQAGGRRCGGGLGIRASVPAPRSRPRGPGGGAAESSADRAIVPRLACARSGQSLLRRDACSPPAKKDGPRGLPAPPAGPAGRTPARQRPPSD